MPSSQHPRARRKASSRRPTPNPVSATVTDEPTATETALERASDVLRVLVAAIRSFPVEGDGSCAVRVGEDTASVEVDEIGERAEVRIVVGID